MASSDSEGNVVENLIEHVDDMATYVPPAHSGTRNVRLVEAGFAGAYEMVLGTVEAGGVAERHSHATESQAMYVIAGQARVGLGDAAPGTYGPGTVFRIPPGLDHQVESLGPEPLRVLIVYSPALCRV
jgi:quercetin dioxygenase-like cupin family protein